MTSCVFSIVTTFHIWACHLTCVDKLSNIFISSDALLNFREKSPSLNLILALVLELFQFFVWGGGGLKGPPPGGIGLSPCLTTSLCKQLILCQMTN